MQQQSSSNRNGKAPRNFHIAHRRSPSELTPLMGKYYDYYNVNGCRLTESVVEQLALQQQIELLQVQQQQILAQHQQFAQAGLLPPGGLVPPPPLPQNPNGNGNGNSARMGGGGSTLMPPPPSSGAQTGYLASGPFGQFTAPPQAIPSHRRVQSSMPSVNQNYSSPPSPQPDRTTAATAAAASGGHNRRHSLALSEAKKAAALAQAKRQNPETKEESPSGQSSSPSPTKAPTFKFPSSPDKPAQPPENVYGSRNTGSHQHSQSMQYGNRYNRNVSPQQNFQFPAQAEQQVPSHSRSSSRNFDSNWRQPQQEMQNQFMPSHRPRGSYSSSISSMSGYPMYPQQGQQQFQQQQQQQQQQQRKTLFAPYLPQNSLPGLLAEGRLVSGVLRVNRKNRSDAYVSTNGLLDADIFICGSKDRNRALEGDLVAIELLEVDEVWGSKKEKEEKKKRKDAVDINDTTTSTSTELDSSGSLKRRGSLKQRPTQKKNDDVEVEGQSLLLIEEEELSDEVKPLYAGHVVAVIERFPGQMFSGSLGLLRPSSQATKEKQDAERKGKGESVNFARTQDKPKIVWFKPTDKRVPLIAIPTEQAPADFVERHEKYADRIFIASIKRWPITSLHPFGTLVEELGSSEDVNIEIEALLRDNNITADVFPDSVLKQMALANFQYVEDDVTRTDFTGEYVMSFSANDKLCDQALHVKKISNEKIELGIHINDLTYFIRNNSPLDLEAKKRSSAVFLKQREINLFPDEFIEQTGFNVGKVSPTVSVVFAIDTRTFEILDTNICLGAISPKQRLHYDVVDKILTGEELADKVLPAVEDYIRTLELLSLKFRQGRLQMKESGNAPILGLLSQLDDENVTVSSNIFDGKVVHQVLEEIFLKANAAAAQKLHAVLGPKAFLRRQVEPILQRLESFSETIKRTNGMLKVDTSSSPSLQTSLFNIESDDLRKSVETLLFKSMNRAKYFVAGNEDIDNYEHYLFNVQLYTHFNAPFRRYADQIVQRQIKSIISNTEYTEDVDSLSSAADYCNFKKDAAKNAQEQSIHLFLSQVIDGLSTNTGQLIRDAIVIQIYESAFDVLIPEFGIEKRVHGDQLPLVKAEFHKQSRLLELFWEKGVDSATFVPEDERSKLSYHSSIKQRHHASSAESAAAQEDEPSRNLSKLTIDTSVVDSESKSLPSSPKHSDVIRVSDSAGVQRTSSLTEIKNKKKSKSALEAYLEGVVTRVEGNNYVQEIRLFQHVPVLLRAELGKSIPCLTVRTLNPFAL